MSIEHTRTLEHTYKFYYSKDKKRIFYINLFALAFWIDEYVIGYEFCTILRDENINRYMFAIQCN